MLALSIILVSFSSPARADDFIEQVTFNSPQPPGSVLIRYGGLRGLFFDEYENQITNLWLDRIKLTLDSNNSIFGQQYYYNNVNNFVGDIKKGGCWWQRDWMDSLPPQKSGAPSFRVIDNDTVAIDIGFAQINSKYKLKMKEFSFPLDGERGFLGTGPSDYWRLRVKPNLSIGPPNGIRRAGLSLVFELFLHRTKLWEFEIYARYKENYGVVGFEVSLQRW